LKGVKKDKAVNLSATEPSAFLFFNLSKQSDSHLT